MSKFNTSTQGVNITVNKSGLPAYKMEDELKLVTMVLTSMFGEAKYYGDNSTELVQLARVVNPKFVAKLAIYTRTVFNMRSVSHVLIAILANRADGKQFVRPVMKQAVVRADDITEICACYLHMFGKPFPNSLKKGISDSIVKFNKYQISKYKGGSKEVTFRDILRIAHPVPKTHSQEELFNKIINETLETPYTWETELSAKGNTTEVWEDLIASGKVGYMALLRNLNNILKADPSNLELVYNKLSNREEVLKSKQLPFRFYSAYKAVNPIATSRTLDTLEAAIEHSCSNIEKIPGKTLIAIDVSGSMCFPVSANSSMMCADIACIMAAIAGRICEDSQIISFDTTLQVCTFSSRNGMISNADSIPVHGGGTNLTLPIQYMLEGNKNFDRLILLSDNEINHGYTRSTGHSKVSCQSLVDKYRREVNPNLWVHAIDLMGYGTQQFIGNKTNILAGWSERIFEFIKLSENGVGNLIKTIDSILI